MASEVVVTQSVLTLFYTDRGFESNQQVGTPVGIVCINKASFTSITADKL